MLQLKKNIPFEAGFAVFPDQRAVDSLIACIKATFTISNHGKVAIAADQAPLVYADEYWGEPGVSSLKYAGEMHLPKPATDIVLIGHAQIKDRRPVRQLEVMLTAGHLKKVVRVTGDRWWVSSRPTPPMSFETMPLIYERAFGGCHEINGKVLYEPRNPVGRGFAGNRRNKALDKLPLPNLEDPRQLLTDPAQQPPPAGFGYISPSWLPRKQYAGTYDATWQKKRAPYLPRDFDARFFNAAHPELICSGYLQGGEPIQIMNVSPHGPLVFKLPTCRMQVSVTVAGSVETPALNLETIIIEPDAQRFSMIWRGIMACDKKALKIEQITMDLLELDLGK